MKRQQIKLLIFFKCSGSKNHAARQFDIDARWSIWTNETHASIQKCRDNVWSNPNHIAWREGFNQAFAIYNGLFYQNINRLEIAASINRGQVLVGILSAGYGLVDANEKIMNYDATMARTNKTTPNAPFWHQHGLSTIVANVIASIRPQYVLCFLGREKRKYSPFIIAAAEQLARQGSFDGIIINYDVIYRGRYGQADESAVLAAAVNYLFSENITHVQVDNFIRQVRAGDFHFEAHSLREAHIYPPNEVL